MLWTQTWPPSSGAIVTPGAQGERAEVLGRLLGGDAGPQAAGELLSGCVPETPGIAWWAPCVP